jgi:GTP cyclohydrolase IA
MGHQVTRTEAEAGVRAILLHVGEDPDRDGLKDTPARVVRALVEMTSGLQACPAQLLERRFDVAYNQMVVLRGVRFASLCEHHLLPFTGSISVGYVPRSRVVGLSKLARLVDCFAHRLQVQERLTNQIAEAIQQHVKPMGVAVVVRAEHQCMACRGVTKPGAEMVTSAMLGVFVKGPARAEFLKLEANA